MKKYLIDFAGEQIELVLITLKKESTYDEAIDYIKGLGFLPAHISHLAAFQKQFPKEQEKTITCMIFALGTLEDGHVPYISANKVCPENMDFWKIILSNTIL